MQIKSESIELVSVDALIPHPKNMHNHPPEQIERLCKLIEYQGFRTPLVVQLGTNLIVAGHGRLEAAKKLGIQRVPVTYQKFDDEAQLYAFMVSDNAIGKDTWATLDLSQINLDIQDLGPELDVDMLAIKHFTIEPMDSLVDTVNASDESAEWSEFTGSEFETADKEIKLTIVFPSEETRESFVELHRLPITAKQTGQWTSRV